MACLVVLVLVFVAVVSGKQINKYKCPEVRSVPHFDLPQMLGTWHVVRYYDSDVEALSYRCMQSVFVQDDHLIGPDGKVQYTPAVTMNYTYQYIDDPSMDFLQGNITWKIDMQDPGHWTHAEEDYNDIYNTYVTDVVYDEWALMVHCAEGDKNNELGARYLTAFMLSRNTTLPVNVLSYLRDKLQRYGVDVNYVFPVEHDKYCEHVRNKPMGAPVIHYKYGPRYVNTNQYRVKYDFDDDDDDDEDLRQF